MKTTEANYEAYYLQFKDTKYATYALKAIENRYSFRMGSIETEEPISEEAEELALKILGTHIDCSLRLNSDMKALKYRSDVYLKFPLFGY